MVTTGVLRELPKPPLKMENEPTTGDRSRSTIRVQWEAPHEGDAPITGYKLRRRAGGNTAVVQIHNQYSKLKGIRFPSGPISDSTATGLILAHGKCIDVIDDLFYRNAMKSGIYL